MEEKGKVVIGSLMKEKKRLWGKVEGPFWVSFFWFFVLLFSPLKANIWVSFWFPPLIPGCTRFTLIYRG